VNLGVGSGTHAEQTAAAMVGLEREFTIDRPSLVMLYGDVNSTLAGSLAAAKLEISSAHVEAGLRSFDRSMPEEINRLVSDLLADLLFTTSPEAADHLTAMGVPHERIHFVGNPMIDTLLGHRARFDDPSERERLGVAGTDYGVVTLHRPSNVDSDTSARAVVEALDGVAAMVPLVVPLHPRGRANLEAAGLTDSERIRIVEPMGYVAFLSVVAGARLVLTDSGGIQEETTILDVPCLTIRPNTERPITISHGTNRLVAPSEVVAAARQVLAGPVRPSGPRPPLWDGHAGERIAEIVETWLAGRRRAADRPTAAPAL
jgi:UDP-N-acetylglucosamine 2-epimerase (non-hydrolysing)